MMGTVSTGTGRTSMSMMMCDIISVSCCKKKALKGTSGALARVRFYTMVLLTGQQEDPVSHYTG